MFPSGPSAIASGREELVGIGKFWNRAVEATVRDDETFAALGTGDLEAPPDPEQPTIVAAPMIAID
jgi:hypothetical protein